MKKSKELWWKFNKKMTEQSIFEHILGDNFYNQENRDGINPLLIPDAASKICDRLSADVTETARNSSYLHYLRNDIVFISKLCKNNDEHHQVNETNSSVVLKCLEKSYNNDGEDEMQMMVNECVQDVKMKKKAMLDTIKKRQLIKREKKEKDAALMLERLRKILKKKEKTSGLEFNLHDLPKRMTQWNEPYLYCKTLEDTEEMEEVQKKLVRTNSYRLKHIKFGYALMSLRHKEENLTHLSYLLKTLSGYKEMHQYEKRFCIYLFKSIDKYPYLIRFYQEELFFILEMLIIDNCRHAVTKNEQEFKTFLNEYSGSSDLNSLKIVCESDTLIFSRIRNIFYALYTRSNFNERILHLFKIVDSFVPI